MFCKLTRILDIKQGRFWLIQHVFSQTDAGIRRIPMSIADRSPCKIDPERVVAYGFPDLSQKGDFETQTTAAVGLAYYDIWIINGKMTLPLVQ
ncbi:MAG: hypothetical protein JJU28_02595 [Cyclobacteriaceae bacterium]|nr:hypothetical protein [Cyclobacteriaceae bacterium]